MIIPAPMDKVIVLICIYYYEFEVTRNHVCLLLKYSTTEIFTCFVQSRTI